MLDDLTSTDGLSCGGEELSYAEAIQVCIADEISTSKAVRKVQSVTTSKTVGFVSVRVAMLDKVKRNNSTE